MAASASVSFPTHVKCSVEVAIAQLHPMLSDLKTEVHRALFVHSGELLTAGNGAPPRLPLFPAGALSLSFPSLIGAVHP
jgi:hypothetical protein